MLGLHRYASGRNPGFASSGRCGYAYAYRFSKPEFSWVYCPDAINLNEEEKSSLFTLNLLILGTSFYKEDADPKTRSVYDMVEALELLKEIQPEYVIFTHMSHGIDINEFYPLPSNVSLACKGMEFLLV